MARKRAPRKGVFTHSLDSSKLLRRVPKAMKELRAELLDYSDAFREMPPIFSAGIQENINSKGSSIGETWTANTPKYRDRKRAEGKGQKQLEYTKDLIRKLASGAGIKYRIRKRGMTWGTKKLPYARALHFGGKPFFAISKKMNEKIQAIMDRHSIAKLDRATAALEAVNGR